MFLSTSTIGSGIGVWVGLEATSGRTSRIAVPLDGEGVPEGFTTADAREPMNRGRPSKTKDSTTRRRRTATIAVWIPQRRAVLLDGGVSKECPQ